MHNYTKINTCISIIIKNLTEKYASVCATCSPDATALVLATRGHLFVLCDRMAPVAGLVNHTVILGMRMGALANGAPLTGAG